MLKLIWKPLRLFIKLLLVVVLNQVSQFKRIVKIVNLCKIKFTILLKLSQVRGGNLEASLGLQNCVFDKVGIGYKPVFQNKVKEYKILFSYRKLSVSPFITCSYCLRKYHIVRNCKNIKYDIPNEKVKWISKTSQ